MRHCWYYPASGRSVYRCSGHCLRCLFHRLYLHCRLPSRYTVCHWSWYVVLVTGISVVPPSQIVSPVAAYGYCRFYPYINTYRCAGTCIVAVFVHCPRGNGIGYHLGISAGIIQRLGDRCTDVLAIASAACFTGYICIVRYRPGIPYAIGRGMLLLVTGISVVPPSQIVSPVAAMITVGSTHTSILIGVPEQALLLFSSTVHGVIV